MPAGRPSSYDPSICGDIPQMFAEGQSKAEVARELKISRDTMNRWEKEHPEFSDAIKKGVQLSEAWWVKQGRIALREKEFNATLWYMNMKNRFGWRDKQDITSGDKPIEWTPQEVVIVRPKSE